MNFGGKRTLCQEDIGGKRRKASTTWLLDFYFALSSYYILTGDKVNGESLSSLKN